MDLCQIQIWLYIYRKGCLFFRRYSKIWRDSSNQILIVYKFSIRNKEMLSTIFISRVPFPFKFHYHQQYQKRCNHQLIISSWQEAQKSTLS